MSTRTSVASFLFVSMIALAGCKQAQLGGPVVHADVDIDLLNQPGASYQHVRTTSSAEAIATLGLFQWSSFSGPQQALWLGNFNVDEERVDPARLYLVTATGGRDIDRDSDGRPDRESRDIAGTWHAIMAGAALLQRGNRVSALTDAAYRQVADRIGFVSDARLLELLDEFAAAVVADINGDGRVDYADVLAWSRTTPATGYTGDLALLDELVDAIADDAPDAVLRAAAESVFRNRRVDPDLSPPAEPTPLNGVVSGDLRLTRAASPYLLLGRLTVEGALRIEPGVQVTGRGNLIQVYGEVSIDGLPRQRVSLQSLDLDALNWGPGLRNVMRNVDMANGRLGLHIQQLLLEDSRLDNVSLTVSNSVKSADSLALLRRNVINAGSVTFDNSGPVRAAFVLRFENNLVATPMGRQTRLTSRWDASVDNLRVRNNSFNTNMLVQRSTPGARMDLRGNYWGPDGLSADAAELVLPDNMGGPFEQPIIPYRPLLSAPHPDTPLQ